jgi:hypothetical protein
VFAVAMSARLFVVMRPDGAAWAERCVPSRRCRDQTGYLWFAIDG